MTVRVAVKPVRDPDTREILGWLLECPDCYGYALTNERVEAMSAARWHPCTWPPPPPPRRGVRWRNPRGM